MRCPRVLLLLAFWMSFASTAQSQGDKFFEDSEVALAAQRVLSGECNSECDFGEYRVRTWAPPMEVTADHIAAAGFRFFFITANTPERCGASSCMEAFVMANSLGAGIIAEGMGVDPARYIGPLGELFSGLKYEIVFDQPAGRFCSGPNISLGAPLDKATIERVFVGSRMVGVNSKNESWEENLSDDGTTLFVNSAGERFEGRYTINGDRKGQLCFSYGTSESWRCKIVQPCGTSFVLVSTESGEHTSLITSVSKGASSELGSTSSLEDDQPQSTNNSESNAVHAEIAACRKIENDIARLECFDGTEGTNSNTVEVPKPIFGSTDALRLGRLLTFGPIRVSVDKQRCLIAVQDIRDLQSAGDFNSGGWSDFLGSTSNGVSVVGQRRDIVSIPLGSIDMAQSGSYQNEGILIVTESDALIMRDREDKDFSTGKTQREQKTSRDYLLRTASPYDAAPALKLIAAANESCKQVGD